MPQDTDVVKFSGALSIDWPTPNVEDMIALMHAVSLLIEDHYPAANVLIADEYIAYNEIGDEVDFE